MSEVIMRIEHMTKTFGPVVALDDVDLEVSRGEIRGLIGENGSGKSTITSIFSGMQKADKGDMYYKGEKWNPKSMNDALRQGVGMIVQENGTVPGITVAENMFLCEVNKFKKGPFINDKAMFEKAQQALNEIGADHISARAITASLDMMDRKLVEVAKVWMENPEIIVVDETTTSLSQKGRDIIYSLMNRMKENDKAVVFISHDLDEIMEKCDTLTVLRDGHIIRTFEKEEFDPSEIRTSMIGREIKGDYYRSDYDGSHQDEVAVEIRNLTYRDKVIDLNLDVYKGEILGVGGLSHCGMHELGKLIFGGLTPESGEVRVNGNLIKNPNIAIKNKMAYAAKDRDIESLCTIASIEDNIAIVGLNKIAKNKHFIFSRNEKKYVEDQIKSMQIKCFDRKQDVNQLSGGNKQKVVFAKWVGCDSDILILDCPTRGIDIGVKQAMYQLMYQMKKEGKTIIMISEELTELIGMSDRLIILKDGVMTREFMRDRNLRDLDIIEYMI